MAKPFLLIAGSCLLVLFSWLITVSGSAGENWLMSLGLFFLSVGINVWVANKSREALPYAIIVAIAAIVFSFVPVWQSHLALVRVDSPVDGFHKHSLWESNHVH